MKVLLNSVLLLYVSFILVFSVEVIQKDWCLLFSEGLICGKVGFSGDGGKKRKEKTVLFGRGRTLIF